ncbi:hypothetical protein PanWU01x14_154950 [Parasponia andersonii]|uniref:Uncharacterized protein n=1 Tax=Parasponia andersonii TaxID=3476 RepID=A0A2P5CGJ6_PARAD|nr:hypothetical protein PanWU01x14_154950 [Parasponia andersonii]
MDDDQICIAEEGDQVSVMQTNPNASGSCSQFQDSYSPSASTTSRRARTTFNVWDHVDPEFKDEADDKKTKMARCKYCSRSQKRSHSSSSISSSSSQLLPLMNPQQSSNFNQDIELDSDIGPDDENFKILDW